MSVTLERELPPLGVRPFITPMVRVGQMIHWWPFGEVEGKTPVAAVCTEVGNRTINVSVISPNIRSMVPKDGVRHVGDPDAKRPEFVEVGAWSHTEETLRLEFLEKLVNNLAPSAFKKGLKPMAPAGADEDVS